MIVCKMVFGPLPAGKVLNEGQSQFRIKVDDEHLYANKSTGPFISHTIPNDANPIWTIQKKGDKIVIFQVYQDKRQYISQVPGAESFYYLNDAIDSATHFENSDSSLQTLGSFIKKRSPPSPQLPGTVTHSSSPSTAVFGPPTEQQKDPVQISRVRIRIGHDYLYVMPGTVTPYLARIVPQGATKFWLRHEYADGKMTVSTLLNGGTAPINIFNNGVQLGLPESEVYLQQLANSYVLGPRHLATMFHLASDRLQTLQGDYATKAQWFSAVINSKVPHHALLWSSEDDPLPPTQVRGQITEMYSSTSQPIASKQNIIPHPIFADLFLKAFTYDKTGNVTVYRKVNGTYWVKDDQVISNHVIVIKGSVAGTAPSYTVSMKGRYHWYYDVAVNLINVQTSNVKKGTERLDVVGYKDFPYDTDIYVDESLTSGFVLSRTTFQWKQRQSDTWQDHSETKRPVWIKKVGNKYDVQFEDEDTYEQYLKIRLSAGGKTGTYKWVRKIGECSQECSGKRTVDHECQNEGQNVDQSFCTAAKPAPEEIDCDPCEEKWHIHKEEWFLPTVITLCSIVILIILAYLFKLYKNRKNRATVRRTDVQPAPFVPAPAPFVPAPVPSVPAPVPFVPAPVPFVPAPVPFVPAPVPFVPPVPVVPAPVSTMLGRINASAMRGRR